MWRQIYHGIVRRVIAFGFLASARTGKQFRIETDTLLVIRRRQLTRCWCANCGHEVDMIEAEQAAVLAGATQQSMSECSVNAGWHFYGTAGGRVLVCLDSVLNSLGKPPAHASISRQER